MVVKLGGEGLLDVRRDVGRVEEAREALDHLWGVEGLALMIFDRGLFLFVGFGDFCSWGLGLGMTIEGFRVRGLGLR